MKVNVRLVLLFSLCVLLTLELSAQTTDSAYQGRLLNSSLPATGNYDFEFALYDALSGGFPMVLCRIDGGGSDDLIGALINTGVWANHSSIGAGVSQTALVPAKVRLVSPEGKINTKYPKFTWIAVPNATRYSIEIRPLGPLSSPVWNFSKTAAEVGCESGAGICSITLPPPQGRISYGLRSIQERPDMATISNIWRVKASDSSGDGPWSDPFSVMVDTNLPPSIPVDPSGKCPRPNGLTIDHHADITKIETWLGDGTVHKVSTDIAIRPRVTLTLAACATVHVVSGKTIALLSNPGSPARLVSAGTADKPVLISNIPGSGNWGYLYSYTPESVFDLSYTTLENGGGGNQSQGSSVYLRGNADPATVVVPMVKADHLVVKDSVGTGIVMESGAGFTADSTDITVTGGGSYPGGNGDSAIQMTALAAGTLPTLHVSGNAHDRIFVAESHYIARDLTIKNRGVPYYFYNDAVWVRDPTEAFMPTLTIEPGVELRFDKMLMIGDVPSGRPAYPARLLALGTAAQPIIFTSSKPNKAAGDWPGIWLKSAAGSRIENARIEYAGGWNGIGSLSCKPVLSSDWAALFIGWDERYIPSPANFVNVTIANSASHGINAMWVAGRPGPDLTKAFTFQNINGCSQTKNGIVGGCGKTGTGCLVK